MYNNISNNYIRLNIKHHKYLTYTAYGVYAYNRSITIFQTINRYPHHLLLLYTPLYVVVVMMMMTGCIYTDHIYTYLLIFICIYYMQSNIL